MLLVLALPAAVPLLPAAPPWAKAAGAKAATDKARPAPKTYVRSRFKCIMLLQGEFRDKVTADRAPGLLHFGRRPIVAGDGRRAARSALLSSHAFETGATTMPGSLLQIAALFCGYSVQ
jgi:hypothetical protein